MTITEAELVNTLFFAKRQAADILVEAMNKCDEICLSEPESEMEPQLLPHCKEQEKRKDEH